MMTLDKDKIIQLVKKYPYAALALLVFPLFIFSGYESRDVVDARLAQACYVVVEQFLDDDLEISEVRDTLYNNDTFLGEGYRDVTISAVVGNAAYDREEDFSCIFKEDLKPLNADYSAEIYQLRMGNIIYGHQGRKSLGSAQKQKQINAAITQILKAE